MGDCANLQTCGIVQKYGDAKSLAVKGFIAMYCKSAKQNECKRKEYKEKHGTPPSDDMMPNGGTMKS
jgi:hypothetical protein